MLQPIVQLGNALRQPVMNFSGSLTQNPNEWLKHSAAQVENAIVQTFGLSAHSKLKAGSRNFVYPRLWVYTWAHCNLCLKDQKLVQALDTWWSKWAEKDEFSQLESRSTIRNDLRDFLTAYHCSHTSIVEEIIVFDTLGIPAKALAILLDNSRRSSVERSVHQSQMMLDLCQELLDSSHLEDARPVMMKAIYTLTKGTRLYPACFLLGVDDITSKSGFPVADGSFGHIWQGYLKGKKVAIKVMRRRNDDERDNDCHKIFIGEAVLWRQFHHPNILPFYGVYRWSEELPCLVSPWMAFGNVKDYLKTNPNADRNSLMLDITAGLEYLHSFGVVHGDLKANNVLITSSHRACLADFGLSTVMRDSAAFVTGSSSVYAFGALMWRAPELFQPNNKITLASDIYSLGYVFYEVFAGMPHYSGKPYHQAYTDMLLANLPDKRPEIPDTIWSIMMLCWEKMPEQRPTANRIVQELRKIINISEGADETSSSSNLISSASTFSLTSTISSVLQHSTENMHSQPQSPADSMLSDISYPGHSIILLPGDQTRHLTNEDIIIALMGPTGTGKSSFVNAAMRKNVSKVGRDLSSCTQKVKAVGCYHPDGKGRKVVFIDTPGFDDTERTDYDVLKAIAEWLTKTYKKKITLTGIIQFHRISDSRMQGTSHRNLEMFRELCGPDALQNVILLTTFWDKVLADVGAARESQLQSTFWKLLIDHGSRTARFTSTFESAWSVINQFSSATPRYPTCLQTEMVTHKKPLHQTSAYAVIVRWWRKVIDKFQGLVS